MDKNPMNIKNDIKYTRMQDSGSLQGSAGQTLSAEMRLNNVKSLKQTINSSADLLKIQNNVKKLYDSAEFEHVVQLVESKRTDDKTLRQYLGLSLFQLSQFNKAREVFESLLTFDDPKKINSQDVISIILYIAQIHYEKDYLVNRVRKIAEEVHAAYKNCDDPDKNYQNALLIWLVGMVKIFDYVLQHNVTTEKWDSILQYLNSAKAKLGNRYEVEILILLSSVTSLKGDNQEAIKINEKVLEINPTNFEATCNQGFFYSKIPQYEKSLEFYNRARKLNPNNIINLINISVALQQDKKFDEALQIAKQAIDLQPKNDKGYLMKSSILHSQKKYQQSIDVIVDAKQKCEITRYLLTQLFFYQQNNFQYAECLATANEAVQLFPNIGDFEYLKGRLYYFQLRQYDKALECFELSSNQLRYEVSTKLVYFGIALASFKLGQPFKCSRCLARALEESNKSPLLRSEIVDFIQTVNSIQGMKFKTFIFYAEFFAQNTQFANLVAQYYARQDLPNIFIECGLMHTTAASLLAFKKQLFDVLTINPTYVLWDLSLN